MMDAPRPPRRRPSSGAHLPDLATSLRALAKVPVLFVASDYDGTLAPIVDDPSRARPHREAVVALRSLAALPQTHVALISGRSLRDLAALSRMPEEVHLVGSHGSEFDVDFATALSASQATLRARVEDALRQIAASHEGLLVETKPASVALHYRLAPHDVAAAALRAVSEGPSGWDGVSVKRGKMVVELTVVQTDKGQALQTLRGRLGASAVLFMGDDVTDEDAFATLGGPDVGVKVGDGHTDAAHRVADPGEVARLLAQLAELRAAWLEGAAAVPIEEHALLSDQRTFALITPGARLSWLCLPRLDDPALFADLLGGPAAGHFSVDSADDARPVGQRYRGDSFVLETRWPSFTVSDALDCSAGRPGQRAGRTDLLRLIEGSGTVRLRFAPRLDFGRIPTRLSVREEGLVLEDALDPIVLRSPGVRWQLVEEGPHQTAEATVTLGPRPLALELRYGTGSLRAARVPPSDRLRLTERFWTSWAEGLSVPSVRPDLVRRSALVLKGLIHGPTGAIAAAATTSLPETIGGVRNWDYRFCWLRDGAMSAASLVRLGSTREAMAFLDWLLHVLDDTAAPERLQPLYDVTGRSLGVEATISELAGYAGSRPVRVGNGAARQVQLDVFGPVAELVALLAEREAPLSSAHWRLVAAMVEAVARRWQEPDHGIWEIRAARRHHVHSKTMCWLTVDRAMRISERMLDRQRRDWAALRDAIRDDVLSRGFHERVGAFTSAYGAEELDAAALHVGLSGLVDADDPRFAATVEAIERELRDGPTVYRYLHDDGLPGREGGFHICASWLVDAYLLLGRRDDAWSLFEEIAARVGGTGLLSEQLDPTTGRALGNHPQAYSHIGLIDNALALR